MNDAALETFARGYVTGFFDVVSAMLAVPTPNAVRSVAPAGAQELADFLAKYNGVMRANIQSGGGVALLMNGVDVNHIVAGALGQSPSGEASIAGRDPGELKEVFDPCLGGGVSYFKEKYGKVLVVQNAEVLPGAAPLADALGQLLGAACTAAEISFSLGEGHDSNGVFLFSNQLSSVVPQTAPAPAQVQGGAAVAGSMSQDEVSAMLRDIGPDAETETEVAPVVHRPAKQPEYHDARNLDMILDIRLTATARLGRVDMPIADILALGPGSIIEVGHLVDEPVELLVNDKLIARGDVVVVDEKFGLRITEIVTPRERIESLR